MEKLIICEGKHDAQFLAQLISSKFGPKPLQLSLRSKKFSFNEVPEEDLVILECGGLDGIPKLLESIKEIIPENPFFKIPKLVICDEDPGNKKAAKTRKKIEKLRKGISNKSCRELVIITPMLEGLIIEYLRRQPEENLRKHIGKMEDNDFLEHVPKSIKCMDSYLECILECIDAREAHAKVLMDLLEKGILLQKYGQGRQKDKHIIPHVFASLDFGDAIFRELVEKLEDFMGRPGTESC